MEAPVLVLGMHRSGTSALTRCVNLLGVPTGRSDDLVPGGEANPKGYWESGLLQRLNDEILAAWDATWYAPPCWSKDWPDDARLSELRVRAAKMLGDVFPTGQWLWKDPRNCLTLPFWRTLIPAPPRVVFIWRNPVEVGQSLLRAEGLAPHIGIILWTLYNAAALRSAEGLPMFVVSYDSLLRDSVNVLERLRAFLGKHDVNVEPAVPAEAVRSFLDPDLRHFAADVSESPGQPQQPCDERAMVAYLRELPEEHEAFQLDGLPLGPGPSSYHILDAHHLWRKSKEESEQLSSQLAALAARQTELEARAEQIPVLEAQLERAHVVRVDLECRIGQAQTQQSHLESQIAEKDTRIQNLETTLSTIYESYGWRVLSACRHIKNDIILCRIRSLLRLLSRITGWISRFSAASHGRPRPPAIPISGRHRKEYAKWLVMHEVLPEREEALEIIAQLRYQPKISIVMPTYNPAAEHLRAAIESVLHQYYDNWELCIVDDASTAPHVRMILEQFMAKDHRIRLAFLEHNGGIGHASNVALANATGEYVALLDHDDTLSDISLLEVVKLLNEYPDTDMIYSDEDKLDENDRRCNPFFKPDWSPTTFLSYMYTCHLGVYRKSLLDKIGGFREGYDGSQDYDLVLRLTEHTSRIRHIAKVLYHWRMTAQSTAKDASNKSYVEDSARRALREAMSRRGKEVSDVEIGRLPTTYRVRYLIPRDTTVHIIIPTRNNLSYLQRSISTLIERTQYSHYIIYVVDNGSDDPKTLQYLDELGQCSQVRVLHYDKPFNYSAINNWAVSQIDGEYILLLNDDTEVVGSGWLEAMLEHAQRPEVGAVGAKLIYPDGRIQHAGVILGIGGVAGHSHKYFPSGHGGYFSRLQVVQNLSAVTAACMLTRREVFDQMGGFNENDLAVAFNDVDYCLKVREAGYQIVYTPFAELCHHESVSRGLHLDGDEVDFMHNRWHEHLQRDPFYNPNLTLEREDFSLSS